MLSRCWIVMAAAARLAALYGILVLLLLGALALWTGEWVGAVRYVAGYHASLFAILFAAVFLLLTATRRSGFVLAWMILAAAWAWGVWPLGRSHWIAGARFPLFVDWSILALPFYLLCAAGISWKPVPGTRLPAAGALLVAWSLLLLGTIAATPTAWLFYASAICGSSRAPPAYLLHLEPVVWSPAPLVIAAIAIVHVWPRRGNPTS